MRPSVCAEDADGDPRALSCVLLGAASGQEPEGAVHTQRPVALAAAAHARRARR